MRSKSPLALMEQLVMLLVFALAAALCLQVFAFSDRMSARSAAVDRAVAECQSAAELLKAIGSSSGDMGHCLNEAADLLDGRMEQGLLQVCYDGDWNVLPWEQSGDCVYILEIHGVPTEVEGLWKAHVRAAAAEDIGVGGSGEALFSIDVAWQGVDGNG